MKPLSQVSRNRRPLLAADGYDRDAILFSVLSLVLHLIFFGTVMAMQDFTSRKSIPNAIQVNLVSLATIRSGADSSPTPESAVKEAPAAVKPTRKAEPEPEPAPVLESKKTVTLPELKKKEVSAPAPDPGPVPVKKDSLKASTFKPAKVLDSARKAIEINVEKEKQEALDKALSRLEEKVAREESGSRPAASPGVASEGGGSEGPTRAIDLYNLELMYRIQQNWAFNERLAGADKDIQVRILIKILKNGDIRDIWFETRSGNRYLDESALKAIKKSSPLPQLPKGYQSYDVGLIFTPQGLR
jgi:colicin import membrane protein